MRNKWLEAKPSPVDHVYEVKEASLQIGAFKVMRHVSSGHAVRQVAIGIGNVCYAADAFFGQEVLNKYEIPFVHDVAGQLATLDKLLEWPYETFLPGHGSPTQDITTAVAANKAAIERTIDWVKRAVGTGATISQVVHRVTAQLQSPPSRWRVSTYFLMHSCILAYLSYLRGYRETKITANDNDGPHP